MNISTVAATEDAITDVVPQMQELFEKNLNIEQYTPQQIKELYPNLEKDNYRQALLRVANASKTPAGKHIAKVVNFINALRTSLDYYDCWDRMRYVFNNSTSREKRHFLVDVLVNWCFPCKVINPTLELLVDYCSLDYDYEKEIFDKGPSVSNQFLEVKGKQYIARASELKKELEERFSASKDAELDAINDALTTIEVIQRIREGELYSVWGVIAKSGREIDEGDIASRLVEYFRVYYKRQK